MESNFGVTVDSLLKGMEGFVSSKTVVGEAVTINDTIILPLVDVSFGVGAGATESKKDNSIAGGGGGGALGAKISPSAVLIIKDGHAKLVNIKNQDSLTKIIDLVPDIMDKFTATMNDRKESKTVAEKDKADKL